MNKENAVSPMTLADAGRLQFQIPIYQRLFVWQDEEIECLLNDLFDAYKPELQKGCSLSPNDYYIGVVTVAWSQKVHDGKDQQKDTNERIECWDIIDGQQRITFLSLFAAFVCTKSQNTNWGRFLYRDDSQKEFRIHYSGRDEDLNDLRMIVEHGQDNIEELIGKLHNPNFIRFIQCVYKFYKMNEQDWNGYTKFVFEHCKFLVSILPKEYGAKELNKFFQAMNSTGRQLTQVDQIRGEIFPTFATRFDAALDFEVKWTRQEIEDSEESTTLLELLDRGIGTNQNDTTPRDATARSILKPEMMLLHVLRKIKSTACWEREWKIENVITVFRKEYNLSVSKKDDFISELESYREWLDKNIIYMSGESTTYKFRDNNGDDDNDNASTNSDRERLIQFQSMLYVSSNDYQEWIYQAYCRREELEKCEGKLNFFKKLERKLMGENVVPSPEQMRYHSNHLDRAWFWRLDYVLWEMFKDGNLLDKLGKGSNWFTKEEKDAIEKYVFLRNRSIEHLHPQTPRDGIKEDADWQEERQKEKECAGKGAIDDFGNLALISPSFNSEQSNEDAGVKASRLDRYQISQHKLESIKLLIMCKLAAYSDKGWTVDESRKHCEQMMDILNEVYGKKVEGAMAPDVTSPNEVDEISAVKI